MEQPAGTHSTGGIGAGMAGTPNWDPGQMGSQAQNVAGEMVGQIRQQANARLSGQISQVAHGLDSASGAFRTVSQQLREQDQAMLATYAERTAERVHDMVSYLEGKDLDQIIEEVERFGRRQPAVFLGGAFLLGLAASRFLKSSGQSMSSSSSYSSGYSSGGQYSGSQLATSGPVSPTPFRSPSIDTPASPAPVPPTTPGPISHSSGPHDAAPSTPSTYPQSGSSSIDPNRMGNEAA